MKDIGAGSPPCTNTYYNALSISTQQPKIFVTNSLSGDVSSNNFQITNTYTNSNIKCYLSLSSDNLIFSDNNVIGNYDNVFSATTGNNLTLNGNNFENYYPGISFLSTINENCMYFKDVKGSSIYNNEVKLYKYGCQFLQNITAAGLTTMEQNKFRQCNIGLVYGSVINPIGAGISSVNLPCSTKNAIQLDIKCNLFTGNKYGVVGSGPLIPQGTLGFSAGNRFLVSGSPLNLEHSFIGYNCGTNINYYFRGTTIDDQPLQNANATITDVDGVALNNSTNNNIIPTVSTNALICTNSLTFPPGLAINAIKADLKNIALYPNPATNIVNIKGLKSDIFVQIVSMEGKLVKIILLNPQNNQVNISDLSNGIYIFVLKDAESASQFKVIKAAE